MDFQLPDEHRMLQELVAKFVKWDLMPLEESILQREARGEEVRLTPEEVGPLNDKCRELGLWGLEVPEDLGGAGLPALAMMGVYEELGKTEVPFTFPPDSPNLHMLMALSDDEQRQKYLEPYARGETVSAIGISEPGAGGDPSGMVTRAERDGDEWVLNGRKIWISKADYADFTIVMAVTSPGKRRDGMSAFIVDNDNPGYKVSKEIPMAAGKYTYEVLLEDCRVPASHLLGEEGKGFAPMQLRLNIRRLQMGAWCIGMAERALGMMLEYAPQRVTFGVPLSERQAVQFWLADARTKIHACRLMVQQAAWKLDRGEDVRNEASMVKVFGTETAAEVIDHAIQTFGAMGVTKEMPLHLMAQRVRTMRIYEGPSEVHRWTQARRMLRG